MPSIEIGVKVDNSQGKAGLKSLENSVDQTVKSINKKGKGFSKFGDAAKAGFTKAGEGVSFLAEKINSSKISAAAAAAVMGGLALEVKKVAEASDEVFKASQRMSVSLEFYQKMESAAGHAGTSISAFVTAQRKLVMNLSLLQDGGKKQIAMFREIGVAVKTADGAYRNQEDILSDILIKLAAMENITQRNILAQELLGRSSNELNPLLNEGADSMERYIKANESAVMVTQELAEKSAKYNDQLLTMTEIFKGELNEAMTPIIGFFGDMFEHLNNTGVVAYWGQVFGTVIKAISTSLIGLINTVNIVGTVIDTGIGGAITGVTGSLTSLLFVMEGLAAIPSLIGEIRGKGQSEIYSNLRRARQDLANITVESAKGVKESLGDGLERAVLSGQAIFDIWDGLPESLEKSQKALSGFNKTLITTGKEAEKTQSYTEIWLNQQNDLIVKGTIAREAAQKKEKEDRIKAAKTQIDLELKLQNDLIDKKAAAQQRAIDVQYQQQQQFKEFMISSSISMFQTISSIRHADRMNDIESDNKRETAKIKAMGLSARRQDQLMTRQDQEREQREKEANKKAQKAAKALVYINAGVAISKVWAQAGIALAPFAAGQSIFLGGMAKAQANQIDSQSFSNGGEVKNRNGFGIDKEPAMLTSKEIVLTESDGQKMLRLLRGGGGGGIHITKGDTIIQGNADKGTIREIQRVEEDSLYTLRESIRTLVARGEMPSA